MASPIGGLITALKILDGLTDANIHGMRSQIVPPAVVIRPDEAWMEPDRYCDSLDRYVAVATVSASTADEGVEKLHTMVVAIRDNLPDGWDWSSVGSPIIDETTGTAFLVAPVRLTFKGA